MEIRDNTKMEQNSCGGFHKWWYHQMVGLFHGKSQSKMDDDLGYPHDSGNLQIFYKRISQHYQDCRHFCLGHRCQLGRRSRSTSGLWGSDFQLGEIPENDGMWGLELVGKMGDSRKNAQLTMEKWGISFWEGGDIIWMIRKKMHI